MDRSPGTLVVFGLALGGIVSTGCDVLAGPSAELSADPPAAFVELMDAVNDARAHPRMCGEQAFGAAAPVAWDGRLELAAEGHTLDMAAHGVLAHVGSDGSTVGDRAPWAIAFRARATIGDAWVRTSRTPTGRPPRS
jgi:hypothetical protein